MKSHKKISNKLIALPVLGLASLATMVAFGVDTNVNADTCPASTCSDTTQVQVEVGAVISLVTPSAISVEMAAPTSSGTFASGSGSIGVSTNDTSGYSVYITGTNGGSLNLSHATVSSSKFVPISDDEDVSSSGKFTDTNTWGWGDSSTSYHPLLDYGTVNTSSNTTRLVKTSASTIGKSCTLSATSYTNYECQSIYIGATGDTSLSVGDYTGSILVTGVVNSYSSISSYDTYRS